MLKKIIFLTLVCTSAFAQDKDVVFQINSPLPESNPGMLVTEMPAPKPDAPDFAPAPVVAPTGKEGLPKIGALVAEPASASAATPAVPAPASTVATIPVIGAPVKTFSTMAQAAAEGVNPLAVKDSQASAPPEPPAPEKEVTSAAPAPGPGSRWVLLLVGAFVFSFLTYHYKKAKKAKAAEVE